MATRPRLYLNEKRADDVKEIPRGVEFTLHNHLALLIFLFFIHNKVLNDKINDGHNR